MDALVKTVLIGGAIILVIGVLGTFTRISQDDGSLAVTGSVLFTGGVIAKALITSRR